MTRNEHTENIHQIKNQNAELCNLAEALLFFERALATDGDNAEFLAGMSITLSLLDRIDEAVDCLTQAVAIEPAVQNEEVLRKEFFWSEKACNALKPLLDSLLS